MVKKIYHLAAYLLIDREGEMMDILLIVVGLIGLVGGLFCVFREKKVTSLYRSYGVYGRFKAYLFFDFAFTGLLLPITTILTAEEANADKGSIMAAIGLGVVLLFLAFLLYRSIQKKCPDFLRKKLLISLIITGMGVTVKICVFFLGFVWKLDTPSAAAAGVPDVVQDDNGNACRVRQDGNFIYIQKANGKEQCIPVGYAVKEHGYIGYVGTRYRY